MMLWCHYIRIRTTDDKDYDVDKDKSEKNKIIRKHAWNLFDTITSTTIELFIDHPAADTKVVEKLEMLNDNF